MKYVFQVIGFVVVIVILVTAVLFYLDSKALLVGDLSDYITEMRQHVTRMRTITFAFVTGTGIADDAANLLQEGADRLRGEQTPAPAPDNEIYFATPEPVLGESTQPVPQQEESAIVIQPAG